MDGVLPPLTLLLDDVVSMRLPFKVLPKEMPVAINILPNLVLSGLRCVQTFDRSGNSTLNFGLSHYEAPELVDIPICTLGRDGRASHLITKAANSDVVKVLLYTGALTNFVTEGLLGGAKSGRMYLFSTHGLH